MMAGMPESPERTARGGRPPRLSRAEIIAAAKAVIAAEGVEQLTMRRLAREVRSTPMALYRHVDDKRGLLLLLLDDAAERMPRPELPEDPAERIVAAAAAIRDGLAGFPWIVEVLAADDLLSTAALWFPEAVVDAAVRSGLSEERAVHAYRAVWYYTAGEIIVRAAADRRRAADGARPHRDAVFAELDPDRTPRLAALGGRWPALTAEDTYREGLRALVAGLLADPGTP
jgi:AcrR family transcriptional regulator